MKSLKLLKVIASELMQMPFKLNAMMENREGMLIIITISKNLKGKKIFLKENLIKSNK